MKRKPAPKARPKRGTRPTLTERQRRFVAEYLASGNATDAARKAGYKHPNEDSARLVKHGAVSAAIKAGQVEAERKVGLSRDERLTLLADFAQGVARTPKGRAIPVAVKERLKAIELIGRMCGDFTEKREHSGEIAISKGDALARLQERLQTDPGVRARILEAMGSAHAGD